MTDTIEKMRLALTLRSRESLETMRLALLTLRDEFSIVCAECPPDPSDPRDAEIHSWHARHIAVAEILLDIINEKQKETSQ